MSPPSRAFANFLDAFSGSSATIFAGRPFHFTYESVFMKCLIVADLPSGLAQIPVGLSLSPLIGMAHLGTYAESYLGASIFFVLATCQWLAIGRVAEVSLASKPWGEAALKRVAQHSQILIAVVILLSVVFVPIVNHRSQMQGFRQPAISMH